MMRRSILDVFSRSRFAIIGTFFAIAVTIAAGAASFIEPSLASAASCPQNPSVANTNVIYCGLTGSDVNSYVSSLNGYYTSGNDGNTSNSSTSGHYHTDLHAVLGAAGLTSSMLASGNGWALGQSNSDGTLTVNDQVVANNMQIGSRCFSGMSNCQPTSSYHALVSNVYMHAATFYFGSSTAIPTLVHSNSKGQVDFAIWIPCGNVLKVTPVVQPTPVLNCVSLTAQATDNTQLSYTFTAKATSQNTNISSYTFNFGDNNQQTVNTSATTATASHTYTQTSGAQNLTAKVMVNGTTTSANCQTAVTIPAQSTSSLACVSLAAVPTNTAKTNYQLTATASTTNTTISSFLFDFGDSSAQQTVSTTSTSASVQHQFDATKAATYTVTAKVTGPLGTFTSQSCNTSVTITLPPASTTTTPPQVLAATTTLPNTGPGDVIGIFAAVTTAAGLLHHFVLRKKFQL